MNSGSGKLGSRKIMRVATVFTGAAACAVAFAPGAMAGTGQPAAARDGHQARLGGKTPGIRPGITVGGCTGRPNWVHIGDAFYTECFGFTGTYSVSRGDGAVAGAICGGNNYGWYGGYSDLGFNTAGFHQGTTFAVVPSTIAESFTTMHISGWKGNDACP
jgi:hypothetical protein